VWLVPSTARQGKVAGVQMPFGCTDAEVEPDRELDEAFWTDTVRLPHGRLSSAW
jgi:hypothetical protein